MSPTPTFEVGDLVVVVITPRPGDPMAEYVGRSGVVKEIDGDDDLFPVMVRFSAGSMDFHWFKYDELEPVR